MAVRGKFADLLPDDLETIITATRIARTVEELDDDTLKAIACSAVGPEHAALDELVKDWTP